jgi:hypothetical protein
MIWVYNGYLLFKVSLSHANLERYFNSRSSTVLQPRRPQIKLSSLWKPQNLHQQDTSNNIVCSICKKVKLKLSLCLTKHHAAKMYWESEGVAPCSSHFTPGERTLGTHWIGGWMGPRAGLEMMVNRKILNASLELNPGHPASS